MDTSSVKTTPSERALVEASEFDVLWDNYRGYGFRLSIRNCQDGASLITLTCQFEPGNRDEYREIEQAAYNLLGAVSRTKPGSIWGSDSDSIGGHVALTSGSFVMNKSGCRKLTCMRIASNHHIVIGRL